MAPPKIGVEQARHDVQAGDAVLVCAYDSQDKFESNQLKDAISLQEFQEQEDSIPKQREVMFYCA